MRFHGFVSEDEKIDLLRRAWANLFPVAEGGLGHHGGRGGGLRHAVDRFGQSRAARLGADGATGFLVPHGDVDALAARMLELADAPALVASLGAGARRFAEGLTWERTAADTERHLHDIIAGSGGA